MPVHNIVLVSDTHLSESRPHFNGNWEHFERGLEALAPDLIINTGDITLDGADAIEDYRLARAYHDRLQVPYMTVPGNHDVGDPPDASGRPARQSINLERRERWQEFFGDDYWCRPYHGWELIGLNAQLMGSGLEAEQEQWNFLQTVLDNSDSERILIFIHKPLFVDSITEAEVPGRCLERKAAIRLTEQLEAAPVLSVFSGHVHQQRKTMVNSIHYVWVPSSAFILPDYFQPSMGEKQVGCALLQLSDNGGAPTVTFHQQPGMYNFDLDKVKGAYGDLRAFARSLKE